MPTEMEESQETRAGKSGLFIEREIVVFISSIVVREKMGREKSLH